MKIGVARVQVDRPLGEAKSSLDVVLVLGYHAQHVKRLGMERIEPEDACEGCPGRLQIPGLELLLSLGEDASHLDSGDIGSRRRSNRCY